MAVQSFQLIMRSGPTPGKELDLQQAELTLGRDVTNDIVNNIANDIVNDVASSHNLLDISL